MAESLHSSTAPAANATANATATPYTPSGAMASQRMLQGVLGRVVGPYSTPIGRTLQLADRVVGGILGSSESAAPSSGREPAQRLYAQPVFGGLEGLGKGGRPTEIVAESATARRERSLPKPELLTASPVRKRATDLKLPTSLRPAMALSSPERMFGSGERPTSDQPTERSEAGEPQNPKDTSQTVLSASWEPPAPELGRVAEAPREPAQRQAPTLEPLIAAVEYDIGRAAAAVDSSGRPSLSVMSGGAARNTTRAKSAITEAQAQQAALEATRKLMEAVRVHATAHGGADDRISLGDMTLISFADKTQQMAAATSFADGAPQHRPISKALAHLAHPKLKETQQDLHNKIKAMAKLVREDRKRVEKLAKERFGAHG